MKIGRIITTFLDDKDDRTLYIKGKWGAGKTHFVKNFLGSSGLMEGYSFSYSSLAGIKNSEDIKRRLLANLIIAKNGIFSKIENSIRPYLWMLIENPEILQSLMPKELKNIEIKKLSQALIDPSLKQLKAVVVLDDLERCKLNDFEEIYTFISFLKESTSCKIILIGNTDAKEALQNQDKPARFSLDLQTNAEWKDKIIDCETNFELNAEDIALLFTENESLRKCIINHIEAGITQDLRKIRKAVKVAETVIGFVNEVQKKNTRIINAIIMRAYSTAMTSLISQKDIEGLRSSIYASNNEIDVSIFNLIENGYLAESEKDTLINGINNLAQKEVRLSQYDVLQSIRQSIFYTFSTKTEIIAMIRDFLASCNEISCVDMCAFKITLQLQEIYDSEICKILDQQIIEKAKALDHHEVSFIMSSLRDKRILEMISEHCEKIEFNNLIEAIYSFESQTDSAYRYISSISVSDAASELTEIRSNVDFGRVRDIYAKMMINSGYSDIYKNAMEKMSQIFDHLIVMSSDDKLTIDRVEYLKSKST